MNDLEWNDYQLLLKVAECGTLSGAARLLGTSQSTVSRRLKELESRTSHPYFFYKNGHYVPTPFSLPILEKSKQIENLVLSQPEKTYTNTRPVRITTVEFISTNILLPGLKGAILPPIEISTSSTREDIRRKGLDLAIRMDRPSVSGLYRVKKLADICYAAYTLGEHSTRYNSKWIHFSEVYSHLPDMEWFRENVKTNESHFLKINSYPSLLTALKNFEGRGVLPIVLGDNDPLLVRTTGKEPIFKRPVWLVVKEDSLVRKEVRDVKDQIIEIFKKLKQ